MRILVAAFVAFVVALVAAAGLSAQGTDRAVEILGTSRKAIGGTKLDTLRTLSVEASVQRNLGSMQIGSDVEMLLELPDKYLRVDQPNAPGMVAGAMNSGFNGDKPIQPITGAMGHGGTMVIRMGSAPAPPDAPKPSPEEQERVEKQVVRSAKQELSRLMLGWFATAHPGVGAEYVFAGEAESPDGKAYVIDAKNADGFAARLFIDQQSHLPLMVSYKAPQRQVMTMSAQRSTSPEEARKQMEQMRSQPPVLVDYVLFFDDWRTVDGVKFPHSMRRAMGSETTEEWTIGKVKINPAIDAKKFAVKN